jgi:hypothetical protein
MTPTRARVAPAASRARRAITEPIHPSIVARLHHHSSSSSSSSSRPRRASPRSTRSARAQKKSTSSRTVREVNAPYMLVDGVRRSMASSRVGVATSSPRRYRSMDAIDAIDRWTPSIDPSIDRRHPSIDRDRERGRRGRGLAVHAIGCARDGAGASTGRRRVGRRRAGWRADAAVHAAVDAARACSRRGRAAAAAAAAGGVRARLTDARRRTRTMMMVMMMMATMVGRRRRRR